MSELSGKQFGLLIAYVLPGFVILFGVSFVSPTALGWLKSAESATGPSVGGFLYAFLFSVGGGVTVSAVRWFILDKVHQRTGVRRPLLNLESLEDKFRSFDRVVEDHYRYYEFYGGMTIATGFSYFVWRLQQTTTGVGCCDILFLIIEVVFIAASRDALRNYYGRAAQVLGTTEGKVFHDKRIRTSRRQSGNAEQKGKGGKGIVDLE